MGVTRIRREADVIGGRATRARQRSVNAHRERRSSPVRRVKVVQEQGIPCIHAQHALRIDLATTGSQDPQSEHSLREWIG